MFSEPLSWDSPNLSKKIDVKIYGHYGYVILLFPTIKDDYLENEKNGLIEVITPFIEKGKVRILSVEGITYDSWFNKERTPEEKSQRHLEYNNFIINEVVPFIFSHFGGPLPIFTCGAANGAYHAANTYFRRPDLFHGLIAMSGTYNIEHYTKGYFDNNCYFNSPVHYLPQLHDNYWLSFLKIKHHVYILSGSGEKEFPQNSVHLADILNNKEIPNNLDIWGPEWGHNWDTWKAMFEHILSSKI